MNPFVRPRYGLWSALMISLTFNAGFGTTFALRTYRHSRTVDSHDVAVAYSGLREQLNLSPAQETQLTAAQQRLLRQVDELRADLSGARATLAALLAAAEPERAAIMSQLEQIAALQQQVQQGFVEYVLEGRQLLDPEQRKVFDRIIHLCVCPHDGHAAGCMPGCQTPVPAGDGEAAGAAP